MDDDQHLSFAVLAVCDALEQRDDTKARESLNKARKHAHAVLNRYRRSQATDTTPADEPEEQE